MQIENFKNGKFVGRIANQPENPGPVGMGDTVLVAKSEIEDWMINDGKVMYGGYTARYALKDMPEADAAKYRDMFRD